MKILGLERTCGSAEGGKHNCPLVKLPLFSGVPPEVWSEFFKKRIVNDYHRGNVLFYEGNRPFGLYFLCRGRVKIVRSDSSAHSSIPRVSEAPDLLGERSFLADDLYLATGEVAEDSRICFIETAFFKNYFLNIPQVCYALLRRLAMELGRAEELLLDLSVKTARERLAKYLAEKAAEKGNPSRIKLPETRLDLAKMLAISPEVLCRLFAEFHKKGLISVSGRDVKVREMLRLKQIARS